MVKGKYVNIAHMNTTAEEIYLDVNNLLGKYINRVCVFSL